MTWRYNLWLFVIIVGFAFIISRLFYWQVLKASQLYSLGQLQYGTAVKIMPKRGEIRTSDNFPIAAEKISYQIFANPKQIKNKDSISILLSSILKINLSSVSANLSQDKFWVPVKTDVDIETKNKVEELNIPGVGFMQQYSRFYPEGSMAATLLGFVGKDENGQNKGYFGLEGYYDRLLSGQEGIAVQLNDAFGRPILSKLSPQSAQNDGKSLILSIDRSIQYLIEKKLKAGVEKYGATSGTIGVMDPKTGRILAMASYPSFDPQVYYEFDTKDFINPFISSLYEPGSTFKPLIMSAALDAKLVTPKTKCNICSGPVEIGGYDIHTWNDKYYPNIDMIDVIRHSDNTGMVFVAQKLGLDRMLSYLSRFGIGENTGIDLQGEVSAQLKPQNNWYAVDIATAGFGQGISITPIELLNSVATIANEGKRMQPQVVKAVENSDGTQIQIEPNVLDKPISPVTAKVMTEIMVNAVEKGEASFARLKGYRIAGKTGTASIPIAGHYDPNQTIASFEGFAPARGPKFVMLVILNRPTTSIYGAETAAPIFFDIAKYLLNYYGIPPDNE